MDTSKIEAGDRSPAAIVDSLLDAKIVIIFADATYFKRWYCLRELRLALAPFEAALGRCQKNDSDAEAALNHVIVALPSGGVRPTEMVHLPPLVQSTDWLRAGEVRRWLRLML